MLVSVYIFFPLVLTDLLDEKQQLVGIFRQYQRLKQGIVVQSLAVVFFYFHVQNVLYPYVLSPSFSIKPQNPISSLFYKNRLKKTISEMRLCFSGLSC